jgi:hypothetical protein
MADIWLEDNNVYNDYFGIYQSLDVNRLFPVNDVSSGSMTQQDRKTEQR